MAIIYSYPLNTTLEGTDVIVGSSSKIINGKASNATKSFTLTSLGSFISTNFPATPQNINEVLTVGNTTLLDAKIGELYLYDITENEYGKIRLYDSGFGFYNNQGNNIVLLSKEGIVFFPNSYNAQLLATTITANRQYQLPNASGTIALTSNLPVFSGTTNQIPKLNGYALEASSIYDNGTSVGIGTVVPEQCAKLQIDSTTQGFLPPVMNGTDRGSIIDPVNGLIVFDTDILHLCVYIEGEWKRLLMGNI